MFPEWAVDQYHMEQLAAIHGLHYLALADSEECRLDLIHTHHRGIQAINGECIREGDPNVWSTVLVSALGGPISTNINLLILVYDTGSPRVLTCFVPPIYVMFRNAKQHNWLPAALS
jgi:hypothetical protein